MERRSTRERSNVGWLAFLLIILDVACFSAGTRGALRASSLELHLEMEQETVDGSIHPIANVEIKNTTSTPVAFSKTFGITNQPWLSLEIQREDGEPVYYPTEIDVFGQSPDYICIPPEGTIQWKIDLESWESSFGGELTDEKYSFDLTIGRYQIRARYADDPARVRAECPGIAGETLSESVYFRKP